MSTDTASPNALGLGKSALLATLELPETPPILHYTFKDGEAKNSDGTLVGAVRNCRHETVQPAGGATFDVLEFGPADSSVTIPAMSQLREAAAFAADVKIKVTAHGEDRMNIVESQDPPYSLYLQRLDDGYSLHGAVCVHGGWQEAATDKPLVALNQWLRVGLLFTGDDIVLLAGGKAVERRMLRAPVLVPVGGGGEVLGTWIDGHRNQFLGQMTDLQMWDTVPLDYQAALSLGESQGLGAIESKYLSLGGPASFLRNPTAAETTIGTGRMRTYQGGTIYWSANSGTHVVTGAILQSFNSLGGPTGILGFPTTDEENGARPGSRKNRFEVGAIYWSPGTGAKEVHGMVFVHYLELDAEAGFLGLPTSNEVVCHGGCKREFEGGTMFWSGYSTAHEVHGAIREKYLTLGGPDGLLGFPISDEMPVLDANGHATPGRFSRFQGGTIYWSQQTGALETHGEIRNLYEKVLGGPRGELGYPISDEKTWPGTNIRYNDFQKGVVVWSPESGARAVTELELYLSWVRAGSMDDGIFDSSCEIITYTSVWVDGNCIEQDRRRPSGHAGDSYNIDARYPFASMRAGTDIRFKIRVDDWDQCSDNDYLASLEKQFDITSFWGMDNGADGVYAGHPSTHKSGDAPRLNTVKYDFRISPPSLLDPKKHFRVQAWWRFDNPKTEKLSREMYANTFRDVDVTGNWFEEFLNPFDSLFYELAYDQLAAKGTCFGMSLEALYALNSASLFAEPIYRYPLTSATQQVLNLKHGYQIGASSIRWIIHELTNLEAVRPTQVLARVRELLARGERALISMFDLSDFRGHTVLAHSVLNTASPPRILVADPNCPWTEAANDSSYLEIRNNDTFRFVSNDTVRYQSQTIVGGLLPGTVMYHTPFYVLDGQPRTPFWEIVQGLSLLLGGVLIVFGDAATEGLKGDGADFYSGADRKVRPNGIPGMARIPLLDAGPQAVELYAQQGHLARKIEMALKGVKNGQYKLNLRSATNAVVISLPIADQARDNVRFSELRSTRPLVEAATTEELKVGGFKYAVLLDDRGRDYRSFDVTLQIAKKAATRIGAAKYGPELIIENPGPARPLAIRIATREAGEVKRSVVKVAADMAHGAIRIRPQDAATVHGNLVVERLSSIGGGVLRREVVSAKPEGQ